jgi:hypothetical protein
MAIETAAMEDLLEQLLKQTQANGANQASAMAQLAKASGINGKTINDTQSKLKKLGDSAEESSKKLNLLNSTGKVVGSVLADLTTGIASTVGNLAAFSSKALSGAATLSDLMMSFKDLPLIGSFVPFFVSLVKLQEENLKGYRDLSKVGVNFGQALGELRTTAAASGVTLDQFNKIIASSADAFVLMGTSANDGAKNFKNVNLELTRTGGVGEQLRNLGFGFEDMNLLTASYIKTTGGLSKQQQTDYQGVAKAVAEYGKELDLIARITGRSREQQEKDLEEQMKEANFQAFLSTKDEATRKKLQLAVNEATSQAGKGGADIVKAAAMGLTAQSEQSGIIYSLATDAAESLTRTGKMAMDKNVALTDFQADSAKRLGTVQFQLGKAYQGNEITFNAMAQGADKAAQSFAPMANAATILNNNNIKTIEQAQANALKEKAIADHDAKTRSGELDSALKLEDFMKRLNTAFAELGDVLINQLLVPLGNILLKHMPDIKQGIEDLSIWLTKWVPKIFDEKGRKEIIDALTEALVSIIYGVHQAALDRVFGKGNIKSNIDGKIQPTDPRQDVANANNAGLGQMWESFKAWAGFGSKDSGAPSSGRAATTFGTTGQLFENFGNGTDVTLHGQQGVFNPQQIQDLIDSGATIKLKASIDRLNSINEQILEQMKVVADNTERNLQATKDLNGNAFA